MLYCRCDGEHVFWAILEQNHLSVLVMDMLDSLTMENMYFRLNIKYG